MASHAHSYKKFWYVDWEMLWDGQRIAYDDDMPLLTCPHDMLVGAWAPA